MSRPPLDGVRVVEYSHALPARAAGALLADLGAQVVQVPAGGGEISPDDPARVWSDRRKWRLAVGAAPADQVAEVRRLLPAADVFIADPPPGRLEDAGLDAVTVREAAPGLVHLWMPPYGTVGRASYLDADPLLLSAVSGYADNYPAAVDRPVAPVVPTFMYVHGVMGAVAAAAGLVGRERTGSGNSARVSGLNAMGAVLGSLMIRRDSAQAFPSTGRAAKGAPFFRLYQGADEQWFYLAALSPSIFIRALDAIGRVDVMVRDDVSGEFASLLQPAVRDEVNADLEATFATRPTSEWLDIFRVADVPAAPVWSRRQWLEAGIGLAGATARHDDPALGTVTVPAPPLDFPLTPMLAGGSLDPEPPDWTRGGQPAPPARNAARTAARTGAGRPDGVAPLPLDGVRVVDLSSFFAGPFGGALLADFGADVIKVEPADGEPYRMYPASYTMVNQGKKVAALNLADPAARSAFLRLLAGTDAMLDNFQPESLNKLGLSESVVAAASPGLVRCSLSAFGEGNELSTAPGFDPVLQSMTGLALAQGGAGSPVPSSAPVVDTATGALAALGLVAGLFARARLGAGQHVRTSLASGAVFVQSAEVTSYAGRPPAAGGTLDYLGSDPARRLYAASDGWLAVAAATPAQRAGLLAAAGHPEWSALDEAKLAAALEQELASDTSRHWLDRLHTAGVPSVRVLDHGTGIAGRYLSANGFSRLVELPDLGTFRIVRSLSTWEGGSPRRGGLPPLGQLDELLTRRVAFSPG